MQTAKSGSVYSGNALWLIRQRIGVFAVFTFLSLLSNLADLFGISLILPLFDVLTAGTQPMGITSKITNIYASFGIDLTVRSILLSMVLLAVSKFALSYLTEIQKTFIIARLREGFRERLMRTIASASHRYLVAQDQAKYQNLLTTEMDQLAQAIKSLSMGIMCWGMVLVFVGASVTVNWQMAAMLGIFGVFIVGGLRLLALHSSQLSHRLTAQNQGIQALIYTLLGSMKYLKATNSVDLPARQLAEALTRRVRTSVNLALLRGLASLSIEPMAVIMACAFAFVATQWLEQSVDDILLPLLFLYRTGGRIGGIQRSINGYYQGIGSVVAIRRAFDELGAARETSGEGSPQPLAQAVVLEDVSYAVADKLLLQNINLTIPKGAVVGFIGETGAGKTTLVDIVNGLLAPTSGRITWDGMDYHDLSCKTLRSRFGYLAQEPTIFTASAWDNITLWNPDADEAAVWQAAEQAHADGFIRQSLGGLHGSVGNHGQMLSGGQRQRLALARELFRAPEILIVDEGTSALDAETENLVKQSLLRLRGDKTLLIVAHRLQTLTQCDLLVVMEQGRIAFQGRWDDAIAQNAWFRQALTLQGIGPRGNV